MIHILTGAVGSGKTTALGNLIRSLRAKRIDVDGFLSLRVIEAGRTAGYDLFEIRNETRRPLLRRAGPPDAPRAGDFFFLPAGLERCREIIDGSSASSLVVVDEIGPVELQGGGFWPALAPILPDRRRRFLVVVRDSAVGAFLPLFGPTAVEIWDASDSVRLDRLREALGEITVRVRFFVHLREVFGTKEKSLVCRPGSTLAAVLGSVRDSSGRAEEIFDGNRLKPNLVVLINAVPVSPSSGLDIQLAEGDIISVFPLMGGG